MKHIGAAVGILHWGADQSMTEALAQMELTAAQGRIMGYIAHRVQAPCPRDIEEEFRLSHPTVSGILSRLEKKEFIEFRPDEKDRRCKRIYMLQRGEQCIETMHRAIDENEARLVQGFSEEEKALFRQLLTRAIDNMGAHRCPGNRKEEDIQ